MKYPNMRAELVSYLEDLADEDDRQRNWAANGNEFDYVVNFLYDDTPLASDPRRAVGLFLCSEVEVEKVRDLIHAIDVLFEKHGDAPGNVQVGPHPEWAAVKAKARDLLRVLRQVKAE